MYIYIYIKKYGELDRCVAMNPGNPHGTFPAPNGLDVEGRVPNMDWTLATERSTWASLSLIL